MKGAGSLSRSRRAAAMDSCGSADDNATLYRRVVDPPRPGTRRDQCPRRGTMTPVMTSRTSPFLLTIVMLSSPAAAQTTRQGPAAQTISRGWTALAAGRATEAASAADEILRKNPRSHPAIALKLEALSTGTQP